MTERLEAWLEGRRAGVFEVPARGRVTFTYADDAPDTPISLSLPRDGPHRARAAGNVLENLLPDSGRTRERMAATYGAASARTFDLLVSAGGDVAGGLVLVAEGTDPGEHLGVLSPALDGDIATRIAAIKRDADDWVPGDVDARFSLAGTQGKFALAELDGDWYWSNAGVPSSHIVKPGRTDLRGLEHAEVAALTLAQSAGVEAAVSSVMRFEDQSAFVTERFDRAGSGSTRRRLHMEDLAQALGVGPDEKYAVDTRSLATLLRATDATGELTRTFLRQLAFNLLIGNADAHAKNYSVMLRADGVTFAPLYDAIPLGLYPTFSQDLAMKVGGATRPAEAGPPLWRKLARGIGFDQDEVVALVTSLAQRVAERNDDAWNELDPPQAAYLRETVARHTDVLLTV